MSEKPQNLPDVENQQDIKKPKESSPFSQENIAKKSAEIGKKPAVKKMVADTIKTPELKTYSDKEEAKLKVLLEGNENNEKTPENIKDKIVDRILKEKLGDKYEQYIKTGYTKEILREKYLASNKKVLETKIKDKDGKEINKTKYEDILEKNKDLAKLNTKENPEFAKELLTIYGEKGIFDYKIFLKDIPEEKIPKKLEEFEKIMAEIEERNNQLDEQRESEEVKKNMIEGEIKKNTPGYEKHKNGSVIPSSIKMDGTEHYNSYNGRSYKNSMLVESSVDTGNIDSGYKSLQEVNNPKDSINELINKGVSLENATIIAKRVPEKWFNIAIDFAEKEGTIKKDKPIALASVGKKVGIICYPDSKFEQFPIITAKSGRTDMIGTISHFDGGKISGKGNDASKGGSKTVLGAAAYSPEGGANGGKWWHGVADYRIPNGKTWGCVGIKQEVAMRMVRSIQTHGGGYGYEVA